MNFFHPFYPLVRAEILKLLFLKIHWRVLLLNFVFLPILLSFTMKFASSAQESYNMEAHKNIGGVLVFFSRYIYVFIVCGVICTNFGKEFEWKTIHQFIIKGLRPENMVLSKTLVYWLHFTLQYIVYSGVTILGYFLFSPGNMTETFYSLPWMEILTFPLGIFLIVSLSILCVGFTFSSSQALIANFMYFVFVEMIFRGIFWLLQSITGSVFWKWFMDYTPYRGFLQIEDATPDVWIYILLTPFYGILFTLVTLYILRKKEYALVNS